MLALSLLCLSYQRVKLELRLSQVLLCKRLYDSGQDALKTLPSVTCDMHAVRGIAALSISADRQCSHSARQQRLR